jgi:hypothetical protein
MRKLLVIGLLIALCIVVSPVLADATIDTNQDTYSPGDIVYISGSGFTIGTEITIYLSVTGPAGSSIVDSWTVTSSDGTIITSYYLAGYEGTFVVDAVDEEGIFAQTTFYDPPPPPHTVNIAWNTSGLPSGQSITISYSGTNPGEQSQTGSITFTSPGPSTNVGFHSDTAVTYSGFPASITIGSDTYNLVSTSPATGFNTGSAGSPTPTKTVMGTYAIATPSDTTPPTTAISLSGTAGNNGWYRSAVDVTLTATDNAGGSGVKEIHYILDSGTEQTVTGASATFTISTDGTHLLEYWAVDNSNNVETPHNTATINIDQTAPVFDTFVVPAGWVILNQPDVEVTWTAHDATSGLDTSNPTSPIIIDTSTVGTKTGSVTLYDVAGNSVLHSYSVSVGYNMLGFLQPINMDGSSIFKQGSTVPTKFQLTDYFGNYVSNAVARLTNVKFTSVPVGDELEAVSTSAATTGNLFRYDTTSNQYIFNLGTKSLEKGGYRITATLDSGQTIQVVISLK